MKELNDISRFWAKTTDQKDNPKRQNAFHPLICHLIDVGVTARALWENVLPEISRKRLARHFGLENDLEKAGNLLAFLVGLHDLGKCSPPFALRGEYDKLTKKNNQTVRLLELYKNTECFCDGFKAASEVPHGFVTSVELPEILQKTFGFPKKFSENISEIIGGHHGTFAPINKIQEIRKGKEKSVGDESWLKVRFQLVETLARLFKIEGAFTKMDDKKFDNATAMIFAGLTTVSDWVGSNTDFFPCEIVDSTQSFSLDLDKYFKESGAKAAKALKILGWTKWIKESAEKKFEELFPNIEKKRHLQNVAVEIAKNLNSVGVMVIESPMGEGKTEAAMFLADAFNARLGTRGIYFALPTQATSNQMFGRVAEFLSERFKGENLNVPLMLQHGYSSINSEFIEKIKNFQNIQNTYDDGEISHAKGSERSNVVASEWFTYRKKGLLVPFGVGTIDQILLGVLQTKHVFVRLFGLAHKTIIIDEVHAYDAYMSTLLERLLEWLAALGSPVIILSATLPVEKRDSLIKAYLKGLSVAFDENGDDQIANTSGESDEYPRISYATAAMPDKTFKIRRLKTSEQNAKTLRLEWKDETNFVEDLKAKLTAAGGGCAAIICNTVDKAQTLFDELIKEDFFKGDASDGLPKLDLLHARFRFKDRDQREKHALLRFGKMDGKVSVVRNEETVEKTVQRPDCAVLISTQIIEQSLDLDFDLMISELAPVDLLLQRAGRLQRHRRARSPEFDGKPTLWLIKPSTDANGDLIVKGNSPDFGKSGAVYDKHILLRSWLKLRYAEKINIPEDIEHLIEDIYDDEKVFENLTEKENSLWYQTLKIYQSDKDLEEEKAKYCYIKHPHYGGHLGKLLGEPREEDAPELHPSHQAATRLVEPTTNVVCLWEKNNKIYTDETFSEEISLFVKPNDALTEKLLFNSLVVSSKSVVFSLLREGEVPVGWKKSALLMRNRVLKFGEDRKCRMLGYIFHLDDNLGLKIYKQEEN